MEYLQHASFAVGVLGVLVILFGVLSALARLVRSEILAARGADAGADRRQVRYLLGYYLLLGLEFLIAADVIDTLMRPDVQGVVLLGAVVAIRTAIGLSLAAELSRERPPTPAA